MTRAQGYRDGHPVEIDLSFVDSKGHRLESAAALAFARMAAAAEHDGIELLINSAFRPHDEQQKLWDRYERQMQVWEKRPELPKPLRPSYPGKSQHESGLAVDLDLVDGQGNERPCAAWLREHAANYGFRQTVLPREPWHYAFVGG